MLIDMIEISRLADPGQVLKSLLTYTQLRQTFGVTNLALVEEEGEVVPKLLSLREMLVHFIAHRLIEGVLVEQGRHGPGTEITLDVGPTDVTFDPARLLD